MVFVFLAAIFLYAAPHSASAQKFLPKSIQFQGDPEYSDTELLAAARLKKGVVLGYAEMQDYSKRLLATGIFATVAFKFDGQDLIFMLTPSPDLLPVQIENLPLTPGKELDQRIHASVPLYHGKVPAEGGLTDDVGAALQKMLAGEGLQATVTATTASDLISQKLNAVSYSITASPVNASVVRVDGVSDAFQSNVQAVLAKALKNPFSTMNTAANLEQAVAQFYGDQGYAAAKIQVARAGDPRLDSGSIVVPFAIQVQEGRVYRVTLIQLPNGAPMTQAEIDKMLSSPSPQPQGVKVRSVWVLLTSRYHNKGYLDCKVTPHAILDDADATVSYTADVDPGPVYHLAFVKFDNVSDDLRTLLIHNWEMMPGDPFDESYVAGFIYKVQQQDPVLRRSLAGVKVKFDATANPTTHEVNVVIRLEK